MESCLNLSKGHLQLNHHQMCRFPQSSKSPCPGQSLNKITAPVNPVLPCSALQLENREGKYTHDWKVRSISKEIVLDHGDKAAAIITACEQGKRQPMRPISQPQSTSPSQLPSFHHCFHLPHCSNAQQFVPLTPIKAFLPALDKDISLAWTSFTVLLLLPRNTKDISTAAVL